MKEYRSIAFYKTADLFQAKFDTVHTVSYTIIFGQPHSVMYAFKAESMLVSSMDWLSSSVSLKKCIGRWGMVLWQ